MVKTELVGILNQEFLNNKSVRHILTYLEITFDKARETEN